jgi:hypothetical protein
MMLWLGFFVGIGAASLFALVAWTVISSATNAEDADLRAQEAGR